MSERFDDELRAAYAPRLRESSTATHRPECPSPEALLAAVRGEGVQSERLRVLDAALRCAACQRDLALLHAVSGDKAVRSSSGARERSWRRFVPIAAAASILLAAGIFTVDRWRQRSGEDITRGAVAGTGGPALIAPLNDSVVAGDPITFTWRPIASALAYTLEVNDRDGTIRFSARTTDTVRVVPLGAVGSGERRWSVRAHMDDGSERRSEMRVVRVR